MGPYAGGPTDYAPLGGSRPRWHGNATSQVGVLGGSVGNGHGIHEMLLERGFGCCLDLLDRPDHLLDLPSGRAGQQSDHRAGARRVTYRGHLVGVAIGDEA